MRVCGQRSAAAAPTLPAQDVAENEALIPAAVEAPMMTTVWGTVRRSAAAGWSGADSKSATGGSAGAGKDAVLQEARTNRGTASSGARFMPPAQGKKQTRVLIGQKVAEPAERSGAGLTTIHRTPPGGRSQPRWVVSMESSPAQISTSPVCTVSQRVV